MGQTTQPIMMMNKQHHHQQHNKINSNILRTLLTIFYNTRSVTDLLSQTTGNTSPTTINDLKLIATILTMYTQRKTIIVSYQPNITYHTVTPHHVHPSSQFNIELPNNNHNIIHYYNDNNITISHPTNQYKLLTNRIVIKHHNDSQTQLEIDMEQVYRRFVKKINWQREDRALYENDLKLISINQYHQRENPVINTTLKLKTLINNKKNTTTLRIRSHNPTSANKRLPGETTRMQVFKQQLTTKYGTNDQIDIFCLQETVISKPNLAKYRHLDFDQYYDQFYIKHDQSKQWRGQAILINKQLQPQQLNTFTDLRFGSILPVRFKYQSFDFIIISIYINPTNKDRQIELLVKTIKQLLLTYPDDEIILIGDYNIKAQDINDKIISKLPNNNPTLSICNHNTDDHTTFTKGTKTSALDHAISITNQQLSYSMSIHQDDMPKIITEHAAIQLELDTQSDQQSQTKSTIPPLYDATLPTHQQQLDAMKIIINKYADTFKWMQIQSNQRTIMSNSYSINSNPEWTIYNTKMDEISSQLKNNNPTNVEVEKMVNESCLLFYETLLKTIHQFHQQLKQHNKPPSHRQITNKKTQKPFNHLIKWKMLLQQYKTKKFRLKGLTYQSTQRIIEYNVHHYQKNLQQYWQYRNLGLINNQVNQYIQANAIQHQFEAEKFIEQIADHCANVKVKKPNTKITTINPITKILSTNDQQTAQNFTIGQQQYEGIRLQQSTTAEQTANDIINDANNIEQPILNQIKSILYPTQPIPAKSEYLWLNNTITTTETQKAIMQGEPFAATGPDKIPHSILKVALHTNTTTNSNNQQIDPTKLLTQKTITNVNVNPNIKIKIEDYGRNFKISPPNESTPMLLAVNHLLNIVFYTGITPQLWQITEIINIPKTITPSTSTNDYRPISLSSTIQKTLNRVLNSRLLQVITQITHNNQSGYKPRRNRSEAILGLYDYLSRPEHPKGYSIFIDLQKAFNSLPHDKLNAVLQQKLGQDDTTICNYIKNLYNNLYYYNNVNSTISTIEKQQFGIKQGCTISSTLFIIYFDLIVTSVSKMIYEFSPKSQCKTRINIIDFLAGYADDLVIASNDSKRLNQYVKLTTKLLKITQLNLNVDKTKILITDPSNKKPPTLKTYNVKIDDNETLNFKVVNNYVYLGFNFHHNLSFRKTCSDLKIGFLKIKYNAIIRNRLIPVYIKKLVLQRYFLSKLLANAPIIGAMLCEQPKNKKIFEEKITTQFNKIMLSMFNMPNVNKQTATINLYENVKIPMPRHFALLQSFSLLTKIIINRQTQHTNPGLNDYVQYRLLHPTLSSPITSIIKTLIKKIRNIKMPYVEQLHHPNQNPNDKSQHYQQHKWVYDGLNSLPQSLIDMIHTTPYHEMFAPLQNNCFRIDKKIKYTHKTHNTQHNVHTTQEIQNHLQTNHQITVNPYQAELLVGHKYQDLNKITSIYDAHNVNCHVPPKLIKGDKPDWYTLLLQSITNNKYSNAMPTVFQINDQKVNNILHNSYSQQSKAQKTATLYYHHQSALSTDIINKLEMHHPSYNWILIHNIRLCRWDGYHFNNNTKIQKRCHCGEQFTYQHILLCPDYQLHRRWAIWNTWAKLRSLGIQEQIGYTAIHYHHQITKQIENLSRFLSSKTTSNEYRQALATNDITTIINHYKRTSFPTFYQIVNTNNKSPKKVTINPEYYLHMIKWRDSSKYAYKQKCLPDWINPTNSLIIRSTMKYFFLMYKKIQLQSITTIPNSENIDLFISQLHHNNSLHHLHSPPQCPDNTLYGTTLLLFLAEFLNLIEDDLKEWTIHL